MQQAYKRVKQDFERMHFFFYLLFYFINILFLADGCEEREDLQISVSVLVGQLKPFGELDYHQEVG